MPKTGMYWLARVRIGILFTKLFFDIDITSTQLIKKQLSFYPKISRFGNYDFFFYISSLSRLSQNRKSEEMFVCLAFSQRKK